jgi:hypothetical protein
MSDNTKASGGGIGFFGLLTILFVGLKLTGYINWSWWWVFAPLWIPTGVVVGILIIVLITFIIVSASEEKRK